MKPPLPEGVLPILDGDGTLRCPYSWFEGGDSLFWCAAYAHGVDLLQPGTNEELLADSGKRPEELTISGEPAYFWKQTLEGCTPYAYICAHCDREARRLLARNSEYVIKEQPTFQISSHTT